jgi:hypothetical protein
MRRIPQERRIRVDPKAGRSRMSEALFRGGRVANLSRNRPSLRFEGSLEQAAATIVAGIANEQIVEALRDNASED